MAHEDKVLEPQKPKSPEKPSANARARDEDDNLELAPASPTVLALLAIMLIAGCLVGYMAGKPKAAQEAPKTSDAPSNPNEVAIEGAQKSNVKVELASLQTFRGEKLTTGRIAFNDSKMTPVYSPYTGRIIKLLAEPGQDVRAGDPLFEIDTPDLVQVESDLIGAVSSLKNAQTALNLAQRNNTIARREIETGRRKLELARANEERQKELFDQKAVAKKDWEAAETARKQAEQDLEQGNKDQEQSESDLKTTASNIDSSETVLNAARDRLKGVFGKTAEEIAQIEKTHMIDRNTRVLSPISGTITQRKCGIGQYISQNITDPLFVINDLATMWMLADVYESDISLLKRGQDVEVSVMAYPQEPFKAKVSYISPSVDPNTHRVAVRCVVENSGVRLKSDMFASFRIMTGNDAQSPGVPPTAIIQEGQKKVVWIAKDEAHFTRKEVATGIEQNGYIQILSGLNPGDKVVADGSLFLSGKAAE